MQAKSDLLVDSDEKENLLAAAAELSDATTELLAAAKVWNMDLKLFLRLEIFFRKMVLLWWFTDILKTL